MKPLIFSILAGGLFVAAMGLIGLRPWEHDSKPVMVSASRPVTPGSAESRPLVVQTGVEESPDAVAAPELPPQVEPPRQSLMAKTRFSPRDDGLENPPSTLSNDSVVSDSAEYVPALSVGASSTSSAGNSGAEVSAVLDSAVPGNSFTFNGNQVALESAQTSPDGNSTDLSLAVTPLSDSQKAGTGSSADNSSKNGSKNSSGPRLKGRLFTLEEERFRTKWGWTAFSEAQSAAAQQQ